MRPIEQFLSLYVSKSNKRTYLHGLKLYFRTTYGTSEKVEDLAERYLSEQRDYEGDIQNFQRSLGHRPPKSVRLLIAVVRSFLVENKIELSQRFWRRVIRRIKGNKARTRDRPPSIRELREILMHLPLAAKTLYLLLVSSGMRIGEAIQLQPSDVNLDLTPIRINIRGSTTKSGDGRVVFASREAKEALLEWSKIRDEYLRKAVTRNSMHPKSLDDTRWFPFTTANARFYWNRALEKSQHSDRDSSTKRRILHPHVLRKYFRSRLSEVIPVDVVQTLLGHKSYLSTEYRRYSPEKLAEYYLQGEHVLSVFGNSSDIGKLQKDSDTLQSVVSGLAIENTGLKTQLNRMEQTLTKQRQELDHYRKRLDFLFKEGLPSFIESGELTLIMEKYIDRKMVELHTQLKKEFREIEEAEERFQAEFDK
jgi:integrase